jgi:hypothetical protein
MVRHHARGGNHFIASAAINPSFGPATQASEESAKNKPFEIQSSGSKANKPFEGLNAIE